jgi:hypothetical protein
VRVLVEFPLPEAHALISEHPKPEDRLRAIERVEQALRVEEGSAGSIGVGSDLLKPDEASRYRGDGPGVSVDSSVPHQHGGIA